MPELNRRNFLIASVGAAGLLAGTAVTLPHLLDQGQQRPLAKDSGILVIVTLYGGNDGINTVIPVNDNAYHDARRDLSFAPHETLDLDGHLHLNPALSGLKDIWDSKELAIVRGAGYPKQDRSHFRSMDIWQTASPDAPVSTGWIGRWLDAGGDDPLRAVNVGSVLPPLAIGEKHVATGLSVKIPRIPADVAGTLSALSSADSHDTPSMAAVRANYRDCATTDSTFSSFTDSPSPDAIDDAGKQLAEDLDLVATCVHSGVPTQVYMVTLGGFDTHANERDDHQHLLTALDSALAPFLKQMRRSERGRNVVVMVYSEFGRRVEANASQGTDHGTSGPVFIAGPRVKGGFYGDEPSLTDLADGDLKTTTDFRDIYHELLSKTLASDPEPSVGPGRKSIGFL
ncbi:DUF1501 domain-containing protein [Mycolicibacterium fluoranthenivorans]|jgi:uncharacterized protein (DUF1501 family)|uniref:DUF1501 domain-containing protein n=1 Tax=Mycolicibacterium fluoranthenivorans TaxID=258505 RepID=A0A1G4W510_9MYCO|nr:MULTISPECIES: DUF1501 domain-containing protein [Mycobacteriaceae]MCV7251515.1 DUF1501 domain-containing protein [Mycobacterium hackensackense]QNJ95489.1 DUF1501 domain-containing protein [Mycolicibacterium fluoranthenivorans]SCX16879.1 Uncharacterized conserved protein, DUF1501 family [Mycolicibacterium fluoranthenivorans]